MTALNDLTDVTISEPANAQRLVYQDGVWVNETIEPPEPAGAWVRPAEWLPMPSVEATEDKFAGLIAVFDHDGNYVELMADGTDYTVDWGDGTVEDYDAGVVAVHQYDFADTDLTDTVSTLGYKQAMVVVTPQDAGSWTTFSLQEGEIPGGDIFQTPVNWLDIVFSGPNVTTLKIGLED